MTEIKTLTDVIKFVNEYWDKRQPILCKLTHEYFKEKYGLNFWDDSFSSSGDF